MLILKILFLLNSLVSAQEPPLEPPYTQAPKVIHLKPIEKPDSISDDGEYFYGDETSSGVTQYKLSHLPPITGSIFFRVASTSAYEIDGDTGRTYKDVYGEDAGIGFVFDYEWQLFHLLGKWTIKASTGLTIGNGNGQFLEGNAGLTPKEKYMLLVSPHAVLLNYKMRYSDNQWFTPYVEGGPGYYTYYERRDDGDKSGFGGAPVIAMAGGMLVSLTMFDKNSAGLLYEDYGINHMWLDLNFRRNTGLDKKIDFSSNVFSAGFGFAF